MDSLISHVFKQREPTSLEAILHERGRSSTPLVKKRKNVNMNAQVITYEDFSKKVQLLEENKKRKPPKGK